MSNPYPPLDPRALADRLSAATRSRSAELLGEILAVLLDHAPERARERVAEILRRD